ncbi:primase alpha helix C-terminal domain-containing protein [Enterococcus dongliensis]|uniref:Primase alpha helix C-terminal domain-containing protein n=1 Tax=Enterococcus dongliensis TaxID=2559925 RepID=A0AAW8TF88_9ENTE|nr:primase alpha helix C-terminal domain-containing protein [Enterococcus dongliensis]MDT2636531.1 primase alpha helix C-terminal domain-containing protein [Enterococcus dongliensis]
MTFSFVDGLTNNKMIAVNRNLFDYLLQYKPQKFSIDGSYTKEQADKLKHKASYVVAGVFDNNTRTETELHQKSGIFLDYDDLDLMVTVFRSRIKEALSGISFICYPTIKNNLFGLRYRLFIPTDRSFTEDENKRLIQNVVDKIGLPCDSASNKWNQLMGLPVVTTISPKTLIFSQKGSSLKVADYLQSLPLKREKSNFNYNKTFKSNYYSELTLGEFIDSLDEISTNRNNAMTSIIGTLYASGATNEQGIYALAVFIYENYVNQLNDPYTQKEFNATFKSIRNREMRKRGGLTV